MVMKLTQYAKAALQLAAHAAPPEPKPHPLELLLPLSFEHTKSPMEPDHIRMEFALPMDPDKYVEVMLAIRKLWLKETFSAPTWPNK
jgi:hypothetical protein